ncbi:MAG: methionyl-tRNA formyltransferase, partial [Rhodospirillaceae bacterium]|nr:methionyl-tRNA formyltransferase [Rhodospirillaceae bacterium]
MRIVINGQQAFGKDVLEALIERGDDVIAVYCEPDSEGGRPDPIKQAALDRGLPIYQPASFKKQEVWAEFAALKPDLCVMAYVTKIVPEEFLYTPTHGTIQYHPSLLPRHRGPSSINWPIIQGATKTGLSIFWPDNGLDTGPILLQKEVEIGPEDTLGSIYFGKLFPLGVAAMLEGVDLVKAGDPPKIVQNDADATYESWCTDDDVAIDWSQAATGVHNLIRGADPQPGAWCSHNGDRVRLYDCTLSETTGGAPGEVMAIDEAGMT